MSEHVTDDQLTVATLGKLIIDARKKEIKPALDELGRPFYMLTWDGKVLRISDAKLEVDKKSVGTKLWKLVDDAIACNVKPRVDAKGQKFLTLVVDRASKVAWLETTTDRDMKIAKAISPRKTA